MTEKQIAELRERVENLEKSDAVRSDLGRHLMSCLIADLWEAV